MLRTKTVKVRITASDAGDVEERHEWLVADFLDDERKRVIWVVDALESGDDRGENRAASNWKYYPTQIAIANRGGLETYCSRYLWDRGQ